ncbi:MAG TPA: hypothetical protein PLO62_11180 [Candidatus Hydrogenedentes bacterium]|nr:hypothetical protein [Candidatus Hydrogenedentota bacterium]HOS03578.1 hypothetical protein [Candidatus Hydrogenedentota bacterium]
MDAFPRTDIDGLSVSRMIIGTNWFMGYSHCTPSKDDYIREHIQDRKVIADILEVFFRSGVDTILGLITGAPLADAIKDAEDRTGVKAIIVSTPHFTITPDTPQKGFDIGEVERILDVQASFGTAICMPHQAITDAMLDRCTREIRKMDVVCAQIRQRGMIPGLSTHMPETIVYADETRLDVATYISIYNAVGFLMQIEVDWISRIIRNAAKPVMTIKPLAAGQLRPFQGLNFVWNTIRDQDMVTVGTMSPKEAAETVELSMQILERRLSEVTLQETRSKNSVRAAKRTE